ncbi:hypothetical protein [Sediminicurvatus halobius]|uniref:Uncharacterized protein n=1 Tax=Sediminicurvatus halobius TaxID=2182432 RepID=A0A2U2MY83_9GAMM|nr:hypothetical protein [Spiribacter halobius]PWG61778.1 hypothetical protein DEM34_15035 [Spiribacter halobius]UEX76787.1 hypothetical protein LMH63_12565 [Spiribacter halobius]
MALNGSTLNSGPVNASAEAPVEYGTGSPELPITITVAAETGRPEVALAVSVVERGRPELPLEISVVEPTGAPELPIQVDVYDTGAPELPLQVLVVDDAHRGSLWRVAAYLDGQDISARLTGRVEVTAEEGAARIAECELRPATGPASAFDYVGATLDLYYVPLDAAGQSLGEVPLFRGRCEEPEIEPRSGRIRLLASDGRQTLLHALDHAAIDAITPGGRYHPPLDGEDVEGVDYADVRLSSLAASLDLDVTGAWRLTPWHGEPVAATITAPIDGSVDMRLAPRQQLINRVEVSYTHRYQRHLERRQWLAWQYRKSFCEGRNYTKPTREMIRQALEGTGWRILGFGTDQLPPSGTIICGTTPVAWLISRELRESLAVGMRAQLARRYSRDVEERYELTVEAPASVGRFGTLTRRDQAGLSSDTDIDWGDDIEVTTWDGQDGPDQYIDRHDPADAAEALETLIARARRRILESHRGHLVRWEIPILPHLDRTARLRLEQPYLVAEGKARQVRHTLDFETGRAVTACEIAVSQGGGATDDPVTAPTRPDTVAPAEPPPKVQLSSRFGGEAGALPYNETWLGYTGNREPRTDFDAPVYPQRFRVEMPEIGREAIQAEREAAYEVAVPDDELTLTIEELTAWP